MESFLIVSEDKKNRDKFISDFCKKHEIDIFDISVIESETSLGIEEVRNLLKKIFLTPFRSKKKAVIIKEAQTATLETQNALLKILEEPPNNTFILLSASTSNLFLPTILSRCKIIVLEDNSEKISPREESEIKNDFNTLLNSNLGGKFKKAQLLAKDKQKTLFWIQNLIQIERKNLLENIDQKQTVLASSNLLAKLQETFTLISTTNINLRFLLEYFFIACELENMKGNIKAI